MEEKDEKDERSLIKSAFMVCVCVKGQPYLATPPPSPMAFTHAGLGGQRSKR